jgi:hypothetical protein
MKKYILIALAVLLLTVGCATDATVVSRNISKDAGMFKIDRRIVFYNSIRDVYILSVEGKCQVEHGNKLAVTCKVADDAYFKHYLGLSDNVTYFSEQIKTADVSAYRYKVIFKPSVIIPDVDLSTK